MKRRATKLILFLLLISGGAIINFAIAWACALWSGGDANIGLGPAWRGRVPPENSIFVSEDRARSLDAAYSSQFSDTDAHQLAQSGFAGNFGDDGQWQYRTLRDWLESAGRRRRVLFGFLGTDSGGNMHSTEQDPRIISQQTCNGWPLHALWGEQWSMRGDASADGTMDRMLWAIKAPSAIGAFEAWSPRLLPLRPIWPAFAINAMFYGAMLWLLLSLPAIPRSVRRRIRAHRGRCTACGYDLRGFRGRGRASENNLCPECGATASKPS